MEGLDFTMATTLGGLGKEKYTCRSYDRAFVNGRGGGGGVNEVPGGFYRISGYSP